MVMERLRQVKSMGDGSTPKTMPEIPGLPRLKPQEGKRNLDLRGDTKTVYEQLASIFAVRVTFDPDLIVRNVRLSLNDEVLQNDITILDAVTGTFWHTVNAGLLIVAAYPR